MRVMCVLYVCDLFVCDLRLNPRSSISNFPKSGMALSPSRAFETPKFFNTSGWVAGVRAFPLFINIYY